MSEHYVEPVHMDIEPKKAGAESAKVDLEALKWTQSLPHAKEAERAAFADWVLRSPEHVEAFLRHKALGTILQDLDPERRIDLDTLIALARTASKAVLPPPGSEADADTGHTGSKANHIESQAAHWLICSETAGFTAEKQAELDRWLLDPRHRVMYIRIKNAWRSVDRLRNARPLDGSIDPDLLSHTNLTFRPVNTRARIKWPLRVAIGAGLTMCLYLMGVLLWNWFGAPQWISYATSIGGYEKVTLPDGSSVQLNTNTKIRTRVTPGGREIQLLQGEAVIDVAHDMHRPFTLTAARTSVQADPLQHGGTSFAVRLGAPQGVHVAVTAGKVILESDDRFIDIALGHWTAQQSEVGVGELANIDPDGIHIEKAGLEEIQRELSWTQGLLSFHGERLQEVADEFNRYNRKQFVVIDRDIADRKVGGTFQATDPQSFVLALKKQFGVDAAALRPTDSSNSP